MWFFGVLIGIAAILLLLVLWKTSRRKKLSASDKRKIESRLEEIASMSDPVRQVLEYDKVLDTILTTLGYTGTLGEKLKKAGPRFRNIDDLWWLHKLRNRCAHETDVEVSSKSVDRCRGILQAVVS